MLRVVSLTFVVAVGIVLGGCSSMNKSAAAPSNDVLNVAAAPTPSPAPVAAAPVSDTPIAMAMPAPAAVQSSIAQTSIAAEPAVSSPASKTYTVKKGDTLFSIAKNQLGSGRDWQKIVSANPGLDPKKLKVGQTITLPA